MVGWATWEACLCWKYWWIDWSTKSRCPSRIQGKKSRPATSKGTPLENISNILNGFFTLSCQELINKLSKENGWHYRIKTSIVVYILCHDIFIWTPVHHWHAVLATMDAQSNKLEDLTLLLSAIFFFAKKNNEATFRSLNLIDYVSIVSTL